MKREKVKGFFSLFQEALELLGPCMDDFLYVYDLKNDNYYISSEAVKRFNMEKERFDKVMESFRRFVHPADYTSLCEEYAKLLLGETTFHDMQYRWLDKEGKAVWINDRGQVITDSKGNPKYLVGCINEIGKMQKADNVTGVLGEASLHQRIVEYNDSRMNGFVMRIGIDNFKDINENRGMEYGDMILRKTVQCIEAELEPGQQLYRIVGDEFAVVDFSGKSALMGRVLYQKIRWRIDRFIEEIDYEVFYTLSAGILALDDLEVQDYDNIVKRSEYALAIAKSRGKNQSYIYMQRDYEAFLRKRLLVRVMRHAIKRNYEGFEVYFQPIVDIRNNRLASAETLLRFSSEETGEVAPSEFVPLLEESGLIIPVGRWAIRKAMEGCSRMKKDNPEFRVSINLSYIQILKSDVLTDIVQGMQDYRLKPGSIVVELTESGFLENDSYFKRFYNGLQENGIPLALDDFGTGYSNFQYLYHLSPDTIKIDRSFTAKALESRAEYNLLHYMVKIAHSMEFKLCIEGIETEEELHKISEMGPDYIQGYYFGRPCAINSFVFEHNLKKS